MKKLLLFSCLVFPIQAHAECFQLNPVELQKCEENKRFKEIQDEGQKCWNGETIVSCSAWPSLIDRAKEIIKTQQLCTVVFNPDDTFSVTNCSEKQIKKFFGSASQDIKIIDKNNLPPGTCIDKYGNIVDDYGEHCR